MVDTGSGTGQSTAQVLAGFEAVKNDFGESFQAADIERIVLVRPMAVTHQTDTEQRVIPLDFTRTGDILEATAPNGHHPHPVAPRGWYMLFVLNGARIPSEGRFIFLH